MHLTRFIKIFLISLYVVFLGFVLFFNSSSVYADEVASLEQHQVWYTSDFTDNYFQEVQDAFDYRFLNYKDSLTGFGRFYNDINDFSRVSYYYVEPVDKVKTNPSGSITYTRGYNIYWYSISNSYLTNDKQYVDASLDYLLPSDYQGGQALTTQAVSVNAFRCLCIYNNGNNYDFINEQQTVYIPVSVYGYSHPIVFQNLLETTSGAQVVGAIQQQTQDLRNETQKQTNKITNAVTTATQQQTNALLDTNDTGNETMSVNDTTTDTSADLGGLFNQISSSFTDISSETEKRF